MYAKGRKERIKQIHFDYILLCMLCDFESKYKQYHEFFTTTSKGYRSTTRQQNVLHSKSKRWLFDLSRKIPFKNCTKLLFEYSSDENSFRGSQHRNDQTNEINQTNQIFLWAEGGRGESFRFVSKLIIGRGKKSSRFWSSVRKIENIFHA